MKMGSIKFGFFWRAVGYSAALLFIFGFAWYRLIPFVVIDNRTTHGLSHVLVDLPTQQLTVRDLAAGDTQRLRHSPKQADGTYNYIVSTADGQRQVGSCGYVTAGMYGWHMQLIVEPGLQVRCEFPQPPSD